MLCSYFTKHIFTLVTLYVSIFAEIPLTPASPSERNDGRQFLKCRPRFEDSVEMEQLKSHLRAGRHKCQLYFTYSRALFVLCNQSSLTSPSSAVLLEVPNYYLAVVLWLGEGHYNFLICGCIVYFRYSQDWDKCTRYALFDKKLRLFKNV